MLDPDANGTPRLMLQYNRARYYDARHGRWLQRDPLGYRDGANLYGAFSNNPPAYCDPFGLFDLEMTILSSGRILVGGRDSDADPYVLLGYLDPDNPEFVIFITEDGLARIPFVSIANEAERTWFDPDDAEEWQRWGTSQGLPLDATASNITGLKGYALLREQMIGENTPFPMTGQEAAGIVAGMDLATEFANELISFYAMLPADVALTFRGAANAVKFGEQARRVKRVRTASLTLERSGQKWERHASTAMQAVHTQLARLGERLPAAAEHIKPKAGYYDVLVHGTPDAFYVVQNGAGHLIDHRSLATFIKKSGYDGGPIRLLSCRSGSHSSAIARDLANKLGTNVLAPDDILWVHPNGTLTIGPTAATNTGSWVEFLPGGM